MWERKWGDQWQGCNQQRRLASGSPSRWFEGTLHSAALLLLLLLLWLQPLLFLIKLVLGLSSHPLMINLPQKEVEKPLLLAHNIVIRTYRSGINLSTICCHITQVTPTVISSIFSYLYPFILSSSALSRRRSFSALQGGCVLQTQRSLSLSSDVCPLFNLAWPPFVLCSGAKYFTA